MIALLQQPLERFVEADRLHARSAGFSMAGTGPFFEEAALDSVSVGRWPSVRISATRDAANLAYTASPERGPVRSGRPRRSVVWRDRAHIPQVDRMNRLTGVLMLFVALGIAPDRASAEEQFKNGQDLTGTWRITATIPAGVPVCPGTTPCVYLAVATATSDGTVVQSANIPNTSVGHGVWKRVGLRTFTMVALYFRFDPNGNPLGTSETTIQADLDNSGRTVVGSFAAVIKDLAGVQLLTYDGTVTATRMVVP